MLCNLLKVLKSYNISSTKYGNEAIQLLFYIIGILVILYGIKQLIEYYQNKDLPKQNQSINNK